MNLHPFVQDLTKLRFPFCFNPYSDRCKIYDHNDAPQRRAISLSAILEKALLEPVDSIWVGRDLGYRGGRRTGLALTDDVHIDRHAKRWGLSIDRPTIGDAVAERTAAIVWKMLDQIGAKIFLWNVFPLHPHEKNDPFSNRQHNSAERRAGEEILHTLVQLLRPKHIVAIGNDAFLATSRVSLNIPVISVRHPSYGGQTEFIQQIDALYEGSATPQALI